ncbi:glycoside hydrolase family 43 protein [Fulvivirga sediminis]|uniref:Glycoside hydrolase family 43 protein n=1 Tax=Fulvivirga sediminis TaxID=2803949 RepID=A0A937F4A4_9BACT|nr:glycoside hydrolase family 43 protein [Fulvivirga sediminis]MBL3656091.1 glycoside hydrolase family 43 protein [Fulvivirga sediminis]
MKLNICYLVLLVTALCSCKNKEKSKEDTSVEKQDSVKAYNPVIKDVYTADPAAMVYNDTVYLYTGHDEQEAGKDGYLMNDWLLFTSTDMKNFENHGPVLKTTDFSWAKGDAWAAHVVEKGGKFYWYVTLEHAAVPGKSIGVAVADSPRGPFKDAIGKALITNDMTTQTDITWDDIDPAVFIDDDGQAYIYWGNTVCKWAKLKDNMIEIEGDIHVIDLPKFTEAPWVHKRGEYYYLSFAADFPEYIDYAMATSPEGPWEYKGRLNDRVPNSGTNHQAIVEYKDDWYFIYHNGKLPDGGDFRRSVCVDHLYYNEDGTIKQIVQTETGIHPD